jgi:hypothetical protein
MRKGVALTVLALLAVVAVFPAPGLERRNSYSPYQELSGSVWRYEGLFLAIELSKLCQGPPEAADCYEWSRDLLIGYRPGESESTVLRLLTFFGAGRVGMTALVRGPEERGQDGLFGLIALAFNRGSGQADLAVAFLGTSSCDPVITLRLDARRLDVTTRTDRVCPPGFQMSR